MTPQLAPQAHLTEDQFGEFLAAPSAAGSSPAEAHLLSCEQCAAELASLRESLTLFRQASNAYADNELRHLPPVSPPARPMLTPSLAPAYWVTAAAALFLAALLPMQMLHRHAFQPAPGIVAGVPDRTAQSEDEALLEDVNREISASVPSPMQALAVPTDGVASVDTDSSDPTSTQRKD
jgi:hypothetical protein